LAAAGTKGLSSGRVARSFGWRRLGWVGIRDNVISGHPWHIPVAMAPKATVASAGAVFFGKDNCVGSAVLNVRNAALGVPSSSGVTEDQVVATIVGGSPVTSSNTVVSGRI